MKLYAITKGCCSDYHIITLTADKENAERIAKAYTDSNYEAAIEEYGNGVYNDGVAFWKYGYGGTTVE